MSAQVVQLPEGCRGFDADCAIDAEGARAWYALGFRFAMRYVRRDPVHAFDLSREEVQILHGAGLAVGIVQHVAPEGWHPNAVAGSREGNIAAEACTKLGAPSGLTVWLDMEGVAAGTLAADAIAHAQRWYEAVRPAHFAPGMYVGWACGLTDDELYHAVSFPRFWKAYNADARPSVRGYCLQQFALPDAKRPAGYRGLDGIDENIARRDKLGGLPTVWAPDGWVAR